MKYRKKPIEMEAGGDLVIISPDERGFWHADLYMGYAEMDVSEFECIAPSPDGFLTRPTESAAKAAAAFAWPDAKIEFAAEDEEPVED